MSRLLRTFPNLYADLSAMSGYNAITRDRDFGVRFLNEFQDKLLFGTDACFSDDPPSIPHLAYLRELRAEGKISAGVFDKIGCRNALRVLKRYRQ